MPDHYRHGPMKPPMKKAHEEMHGDKKDKPAPRAPKK